MPALKLLLVLGMGVLGCRASAAPPEAPVERSAEPGINTRFENEDIDVETWARRFGSEEREVAAAREAIVAAMQLKPGQTVADVGAGTGLFVPLLGQKVGPKGRVLAVDISPAFLQHIEAVAAANELDNVRTVLGRQEGTTLEAGTVDVVFHSDTYHHFEDPAAMNRDLFRALKPGGQLYVVDFDRRLGESSEFVLRHVNVDAATVQREIEAAGFEFVERIELPELEQNFFLHFRRP